MTPVPERPDYSSVPKIHFRPNNEQQRRYVLDRLIAIGVPIYNKTPNSGKDYPVLSWDQEDFEISGSEDVFSETIYKSEDDFLAPFVAIHKEWEEGRRAAYFVSSIHGNDTEETEKPSLLVPSDEERQQMEDMYCEGMLDSHRSRFRAGMNAMRDKIIEINK